MNAHPISEIGSESVNESRHERRLESLDHIVREIADRRLEKEFPGAISPAKDEALLTHADRIETAEGFKDAARRAGLAHTENVLGWSTDLESPAHVLKGEVPREIATVIHEDLHRLTHPETLKEMTATHELRDLYEGITEYLTDSATKGLHGYKSGECYPDEVEAAKRLITEVGDNNLRSFFFKHEMTGEVSRAIERLQNS